MKCPKCQFDNRSEVRFCEECGTTLRVQCLKCGAQLPPSSKFCGECGQRRDNAETFSPSSTIVGQRKLISVLFSDLSGFTAMTEKMDSEEVKEIMDSIFGKIAKVITKYQGFIEKFIGDAVMAIFGAPKAHEDDAVRAIRAAREIHELVRGTGSKLQNRIGQALLMHSGIDTGVVVTGEMEGQKGTLRFTGDTINRAARLCSVAKSDEIIVGLETYREAEAHFLFSDRGKTLVKGRNDPLIYYKVLSSKLPTSKTHRIGRLRSELIGRSLELAQLAEARNRLEKGKGTIISIYGDPGTGKSRLVEEYKATLNLERYRWLEAHAYAYTQNIPYLTLMDLLNRSWRIEEDDTLEQVREKIRCGVEQLLGKNEWVSSCIGSLYDPSQPGRGEISPEIWKTQLYEAVHLLFAARTQNTPTVVLLEDIQWADLSSLELLRFLVSELKYTALFLCVYRPPFNLFTSHQLNTMGKSYHEIRLEDLSPSEAQVMTESLLQTKNIPFELRRFIQEMTGGNPFYLEEVMHTLIESEILINEEGNWKCTKPLSEAGICPTVQGVISARIDHLNAETKRILQEASVIGRAFLFQILQSVTGFKNQLDHCLTGLERLDLIRARSVQPDLEYVFKHALTHEVVYNGLLKKERQIVHDRIGRVMETLFLDRLPEFYETLAFHFQQGKSIDKAVDYLVKSGEKNLKRYAVDESHRYFEEAFNLLNQQPNKTPEALTSMIDLLIKWASVHYYSGHYAKLLDRLEAYRPVAESLTDKSRLGMFYAWLGWTMWHRERLKDGQHYLTLAIQLGEEIGDLHVVGYACAWLTWICADMGLLDEAEKHGRRAHELSAHLTESDQLMHSLAALGYVHWHKGERTQALETGRNLVEFGQSHFNVRSIVMGHTCKGFSHCVAGDYDQAVFSFQEAMQVSIDPWYSQFPAMGVCYARALAGRLEDLEEPLRAIISFGMERGAEYIGSGTRLMLGLTLIANGKAREGMEIIEETQRWWIQSGSRMRYVQSLYVAGKTFAQIFQRSNQGVCSTLSEGITAPDDVCFAQQKALEYLNKATEIAEEIGAKDHLSKCYLALGLLLIAMGEIVKAEGCLSRALALFRECDAELLLKQAQEALSSIKPET